jgi:hypothetical protein
MNETGVEIGDEEAPARLVEHDVAEAGAAVARNGRKQRDRAGLAFDPVDAARTARGSELTGHPPCAGLSFPQPHVVRSDDLNPECRGLAEIDVRDPAVVERDRKDLAHILGQHFQRARHRDELALRRSTRYAEAEDFGGRPFEIDVKEVEQVGARRGRTGHLAAGEAGDDGVARRQDALRHRGRWQQEYGERKCGELAQSPRRRFHRRALRCRRRVNMINAARAHQDLLKALVRSTCSVMMSPPLSAASARRSFVE